MAVSRYNYVRSAGDAVVQVVVVDTTAELPVTHVEGSLVYDKQTDTLYVSDGTNLDTVGAGTPGATGSAGPPGPPGEPGEDGMTIVGPAGAPGAAGSTGATGAQGERGIQGTAGEDGDTFFGVPGLPGAAGVAGNDGAAGAAGAAGPPGLPGDEGDSFFGVPGTAGAGTAVTFVRKATTESVTSNTVNQADDELTFAIGANETWVCEFVVLYDGAATADIKFALSAPSGATWSLGRAGQSPADDTQPALAVFFDVATSTAGNSLGCGTTGAATTQYVRLDGIVRNGSTAGVVSLVWSQVTTNVSAVRVLSDSYLQAWPAARVTTYGAAQDRYATGSFVVPTGSFRMMVKNMTLTGTDRATLAGTARLRID